MFELIKVLISIALLLYIYNNSYELRIRIKNFVYNKVYAFKHRNDEEEVEEDIITHDEVLKELAEIYRVPTMGSGKEIDEFEELKNFHEQVFDEDNYNPPTGIYTHSSELEDADLDFPDIYDKEVAD